MLQTTFFVLKRPVKFLAQFLPILSLGITFTSAEINFVDINQNNVDLPEGVDAGSAEAADIDGDGDMDFVIKDFSAGGGAFVYGIKWVRNNGNGSWTVLPVSNLVQTGNTVIHLADMDSDGDIDIITGSGGAIVSLFPSFDDGVGAALRVYSNNGRGIFTAKTILETTLLNRFSTGAKFIEGVTTADMDGDSDPDIVVLQGRSVDRVSWIPNNGNGNYGSPQVIRQQDGFDPYEVDAADVDGDGDIDVVVSYLSFSIAGPGTGEIICMKNPGNGIGQWVSTVVPGSDLVPVKYNMYLADLDQDSLLDIVASGLMRPELIYYKGNVTGNFEAPRGGDLGLGNITGLHIADFDNDEDPDVLLTTSERIVVLEYEGGVISDSLELQAPRLAPPRGGGSGIFTKDMNGDGSLDMITYGEKITWYGLTLGGNQGPGIIDTDSDGITDDLEQELGTNPNDATDRPIETGASIGINFLSDRNLSAIIVSDELAGYPTVAQKSWNNTNGDAKGNGSNFLGGNDTLTDGDGNASRAIVSWSSSGTWTTSNGNNSGDNKLMNGYLDHVNSDGYSRVDIYNITYANYDAYVYFGSDGNGRTGTIESTTAGQAFSYTTYSQQGGAFPGGYIITVDQGNTNPAANFCVFRDQSLGSFSVQINRGNGNSGICGIQIVPSDKGNDILDGVGATRADAISLGVLADPDTIIDFNTLQSSIDTEIGLYRPDGGLLAESDNVFGGFQSGLRFQNLYSGIWYLAVGENDTIFTDGFSVRGGPPGGIFMLSVNDTREINARIQETGVTWFSFEIRPNPLGLPPENPLPLGQLGDGTLPLSFNTFGSNTDTEIALYGPNGDLLIENDDFNGAPQSSITARNLVEGTYHIAVGRYDTRFKDGFSVERRPTGSDNFILNLGTSQGIREVIPEVGVKWFSFEVGPVIIPEVAFNSVRLSEGNVIISWNTLEGQNYQVQRSNDMKRWVNVGGLEQGTGNVLDYSETASKKQEFFRVVIP
jgi:hypothetical protein